MSSLISLPIQNNHFQKQPHQRLKNSGYIRAIPIRLIRLQQYNMICRKQPE